VSGFWHGANWTFLMWGFLNALFIMPSILFKTNRKNLDIVAEGRLLPSLRELFNMVLTFGLTVFAWIFFRADSIHHAFNYISGIFTSSLFEIPRFVGRKEAFITTILIIFFLIIEWLGRENNYALEKLVVKWPRIFKWAFYYGIGILIFLFAGKEQQFIYFQF